MTRRAVILYMFLCLIAVPQAARTNGRADARVERKPIEAQLERVRVVFEKKKFDDLPKLCTPDCKFKMENGQWIRNQEMVDQLKQFMEPMQDLKITQRLRRMVIKGRSAEVTALQTTTGSLVAPQETTKHTLRSVETLRYGLSKTAEGWKLKSWNTVSGKTYIDGIEQK